MTQSTEPYDIDQLDDIPSYSQADDWHHGRIDHDAARAYAAATNDHTPAFADGTAVPLLYTTAMVERSMSAAMEQLGGPSTVSGYRASLHAEHDVHVHRPALPGARLSWRSEARSIHHTPAGPLLTVRVLIIDDQDRPLAEHLWSTIFAGGTLHTSEIGAPLPDHRFPEEARALPMGRESIMVHFDQGFRFAGVSGDHVPHAMDDEAARAEGFTGKILQGMCTLAMCSGAVVRLGAGGNPNAVKRFAARLAAPTYPNHELHIQLYDAGVTDAGLRAVAFEAVSNGIAVIKHGRAEIDPSAA